MLTILFFYFKWYRKPYMQVWHFFHILGIFFIFSCFKGVVCLQLPGYLDMILSVNSCLVTLMWYCRLQLPGNPDVVLSVYSCLVTLLWCFVFTVAWLPWCGVVCLQLPGYHDVVLSVYSCLVTLMWCCLLKVAWLPWCGVVCLQLPGYPDVVLSGGGSSSLTHRENAKSAFLPHNETVWKRALHAW